MKEESPPNPDNNFNDNNAWIDDIIKQHKQRTIIF